ncbi:MAG TPA: CHAT domain-containing tetratricopeptide repeat protein [Gemmataceae bacterium]|jgi:CHAT domain-containing protein/tetratricopeptide (TPR) repeat protein|nr:CHAT domain-containing tetratricopeptide repeat protein [Gemmataceae bacterium]
MKFRHFLALAILPFALPLAMADDPPKKLSEKEQEKLLDEYVKISEDGLQLLDMGEHVKALQQFEKALEISRKAYPKEQYPAGHLLLVKALNQVAMMHEIMGRYDKAVPFLENALAMEKLLYPADKFPDGHAELIKGALQMGYVRYLMGDYQAALEQQEQAMAMARKLYPPAKFPDGHPDLVHIFSSLGELLKTTGQLERSRACFAQSLEMARKLFPPAKYPDGDIQLAECISAYADILRTLGQFDQALAQFEQALAMYQKLCSPKQFPLGHPRLAGALGDLAFMYLTIHQAAKALPLAEQALTIDRKLYGKDQFPEGHPTLARDLAFLSLLFQKSGQNDKALAAGLEAVGMYEKLFPAKFYPAGHPELATALNGLGVLLKEMGRYQEAKGYIERGLATYRKQYPPENFPAGHIDLASCLCNLSLLASAMGQREKALEYAAEAMKMQRQLIDRDIAIASESEALTLIQSLRFLRDFYLSAAATVKGADDAAYREVWDSKAAATRVLERRHAAARLAGNEAAPKLAQLRDVRRQIERLIQNSALTGAERDKRLAELGDQRDRLERDLAMALPLLAQRKQRDAFGADDLSKSLPVASVFIDIVGYVRLEQDPQVKGRAGETVTDFYAAFIVAPGKPAERVELGPARQINDLVTNWRKAIDAGDDRKAAAEFRRLVWDQLAQHISAGARTIYLSPDGDLARVPWAAVPGSKPDSILLEEYAGGIAVVPHGPFLLEELKFTNEYAGAGSALLLGDVNYGTAKWPALPGTAREISALQSIRAENCKKLTKADATSKQLTEILPATRYAHLATHGLFAENELTAENRREQDAVRNWQFTEWSLQRPVAAKNPLAFTGLVLANGEVLTGLSLIDLPLENLRLATLSACETGLGELTGGEGMQGLQRALHLAGCLSVVATLWSAGDPATTALMARFYHELWVNQKEPLAALREAQLTIYLRPDLIPDLAGERGEAKLKEAMGINASEAATPQAAKRASTRLWAGFVLSGVGK